MNNDTKTDDTQSTEQLKNSERIPFRLWFVAAVVVSVSAVVWLLYPERLLWTLEAYKNSQKSFGRDLLRLSAVIVVGALIPFWIYLIRCTFFKGHRFPRLAGHWIGVILPVVTFYPAFANTCFRAFFEYIDLTEGRYEWIAFMASYHFFLIMLWAYPLYFRPLPQHWSIFFLTFLIVNISSLLFYAFHMATAPNGPELISIRFPFDFDDGLIIWEMGKQYAQQALGCLAIALLAVDFLRHRKTLDWLHWYGAGGLIALYAIESALYYSR